MTPSEWTLLDVNPEDTNAEGHYAVSLQNPEGENREDLFIPPTDEYAQILSDFEDGEFEITLTVVSAMGIEKIMPQHKTAKA